MRYKLLLEYDGSAFFGWQRQKENISVQEVLENALTVALRHAVVLSVCGRTDTGVHATGQVAHFDTPTEVDCFRLTGSLNALVRPHPVAVKEIVPVADTFDARFSARQRTYVYKIQNTVYPPVLRAGRVAHVPWLLDEKKMHKTGQMLLGKHDFSTFRASGCQAKSPVKTLDELCVWREGEMVYVRVRARSFLYHQVRNMVGTLMLVGSDAWSEADFKRAFEACDRTQGGPTAPAEGLYFTEVLY